MEQVVNERPFFEGPLIKQQKTSTDGILGAFGAEYQDLSHGWYPKRQTGLSRTPIPMSLLGSIQPLQVSQGNFAHQMSFEYQHCEPGGHSGSRLACRNFIQGKCTYGAACKFQHSKSHENSGFRSYGDEYLGNAAITETCKFIRAKMDDGLRNRPIPCRNFIQGKCSYGAACKFQHSNSHDNRPVPCRNFIQGKCSYGAACKFQHSNSHENSGFKSYGDEHLGNIGIAKTCQFSIAKTDDGLRNRPFSQVCQNFPPCWNFQGGRSHNGESCTHVHTENISYVRPRYDQGAHLQEFSSVPRNPRAPMSRTPCRYFLNGTCFRGVSCPYLHTTVFGRPIDDSGNQWGQQLVVTSSKPDFVERTMNIIPRYNQHDKFMSRGLPQSLDTGNNLSEDSKIALEKYRAGPVKGVLQPAYSQENKDISSRRSLHSFGDCKKEGKWCFKLNLGRCDRGESCRYLHSFHAYARSIADGNKHADSGPRDYSFDEKTERTYVNNGVGGIVFHRTGETPVMEPNETQGDDKVASHRMPLDQCPSISILNQKSEAEIGKGGVIMKQVKQDGEGLVIETCETSTSAGKKAINVETIVSDSTVSCEKNHTSPVESVLNKDSDAEMKIVSTPGGNEKTEAVKGYSRKRKRQCSECPADSMKKETTDSQNVFAPVASADLSTIDHPVQQHNQKNEELISEIQNSDHPALPVLQDEPMHIDGAGCCSMQTSDSLSQAATSVSKRKLLVLDLNGILVDITWNCSTGPKPNIVVSQKGVYKRPFCDEFLEFCFKRFDVGIWSSRVRKNLDKIVDFVMGDSRKRLLFCWDQSHCTQTGFNTREDRQKPLVLKELGKLWEKRVNDLPWERGYYNETNTVLLDDSPYKALRNPPNTAIFLHPYSCEMVADQLLGPDSDLRKHLIRVSEADNVQKFIEENPFGQDPITESSKDWGFYRRIAEPTARALCGKNGSNGGAPPEKRGLTDVAPPEKKESTDGMLPEKNKSVDRAPPMENRSTDEMLPEKNRSTDRALPKKDGPTDEVALDKGRPADGALSEKKKETRNAK